MAAFIRKQYAGSAVPTTTTTLLTVGGTSVDILATTGWPSLAGIPFYVVIGTGSAYEEKCLATISGNTLTLTRAQDDTTAYEHAIGSQVYPVLTANDADEANELVTKLTTKGDLLVTDGNGLFRLDIGENGYFLKANNSASFGVEWGSIPTINSLDDVGDVTITTIEDGDFLKYSTSASAWINETVHFLTVSDTAPSDEVKEGDLWYNSSELELYTYYSSNWVQVTLTPEFLTVEELDNVYISTVNTGDVLAFDGLDWYNDTVTNLLGPDISANTVTASIFTGELIGNASTASALETSRTIALSGDVSGSVSFDGSQDVSISTTVQINSITLGTDTNGNYMSGLSVQNGLTVSHTPGEGSSATVGVDNALLSNFLLEGASGNSYGLIGTSAYLDVKNTNGYNKEIELDISAVETKLNTDGYLTESSTSTLTNKTLTSPKINENVAITATSTELNYVDGVTSAIQTQLDNKASSTASPVITLAGDLSGSATFTNLGNATLTATISANSVALGTDTTGNYMSDLTQGTGVTITHTPSEGSNATIAIGQAVGTSASVTFANVNATGDLIVGGDLTVNGTTTTLNTETLAIEDNIVVLNSNVTGSPTTNAGIEVERGTSTNVLVRWNETTDKWETTNDGSTYSVIATNGNIALGTDTTGNYMSDLTQGTGITITHTPGEGSNATIAIGQDVSTSASPTFVNLNLDGNIVFEGTTANEFETKLSASDPTADRTITLPDASTILVGTDTTQTLSNKTLTTPTINGPEITATGGTPRIHGIYLPEPHFITFEGSTTDEFETVLTVINPTADRTVSLPDASGTVAISGSIALGTDTTGNYMANVSASTGISISHTQGEGSTATISTTGVQTLGAKAGNYTLAAGDAAETIIIMDSSSANDLTVPPASSVAFATGTSITVVQRGTGKTRILAGAGVTLLATPGVYLRARYSSCTMVKTENANEWFVIGDLAAS